MKNILKQCIRTLKRKKTSSIITIGGFAISMAVVFILASFLVIEKSVDTEFSNAKSIYRIARNGDNATVPQTFMEDVRNKIPGIKKICLYSITSSLYRFDSQKQRAKFISTNDDFIDIFSLHFVSRLKEAKLLGNNIFLTQSFSKKLYGENNPVGETLEIRNENYSIVAVISDPPKNSSFDFEIVTSLDKPMSRSGLGYNEEQHTMYKSFVLLDPLSTPEHITTQISGMLNHWQAFKEDKLSLESLDQVYFDTKKRDDLKHANVNMIFVLSCIAVVILFMTIFNYVSMAVSAGFERLNEIGIRKSTGAGRAMVFKQFIIESVFISFVAMALALLVAVIISPFFTEFLGKEIKIIEILMQPKIIGASILIFIFVGVLSGIYPAFKLSGITPIQIISRQNVLKKANSRSGIVAFQFFITIVLITSLLLIDKQIDFIKHKDLGFGQDSLIRIDLEGNTQSKWKAIKSKLLTNPQIRSVSATMGSPLSVFANSSGSFDDLSGKEVKLENVSVLGVDDDFLKTFGLTLVAGKQFESSDGDVCLINESLYKTTNWRDFFGEKVFGSNVVGVVKDFNYLSLYRGIGYLQLKNLKDNPSTLNVRISGDIAQAIGFIKNTFNEIEPGTALDYRFYDDWVQSMYENEEKQAYAIKLFAIIAILISCLGLIGLAQNITTRKTKEIGIRKVNGARISEVIAMLNKDFIKWIVIAFAVAAPASWYLMNRWLENFAYKTELSWWIFAVAGLLALGIALLTVSWKSWKAATRNPVEALRYE